MRYSTKFLIGSILSGVLAAFLYVHPLERLKQIISLASVSLTINKLIILFSIFFCVEFLIIALIIRLNEK